MSHRYEFSIVSKPLIHWAEALEKRLNTCLLALLGTIMLSWSLPNPVHAQSWHPLGTGMDGQVLRRFSDAKPKVRKSEFA